MRANCVSGRVASFEALGEGIPLGLCPAQPRLELSPMPRQQHDVHHGQEEQGDRSTGSLAARQPTEKPRPAWAGRRRGG